jgi:putative membrane protein
MRSIQQRIILVLKGVAMGAADVVPGVSGGTIAFISGIYEELIESINKVNFQSLRVLFKEGFMPFWKAINGSFLLSVLSGIFISILSLARLLSYTLEVEPIATWSFFFGLILASIPLVGKRVKQWKGSKIFAFVAGAIIAWLVTELPPVTEPGASWYLFVSGMIAICAMILPGISGSFILILLGSYFTVLDAVNNFDIGLILIFMAGAVVGLLIFSRFLKFMFDRFHDITIAVLAGFLLGSLNKIWPWKNVLESVTKHAGKPNEREVAILEESVSPWTFTELTGQPAQLTTAILLCLLGIGAIFLIDRLAVKKS